ncbi:hypothetical protein HR51_35140 [Burkholderia cepacia]|nr:hypothetical protein HR51_35140 [Burkholderia cepacia]
MGAFDRAADRVVTSTEGGGGAGLATVPTALYHAMDWVATETQHDFTFETMSRIPAAGTR